MLCKKCNRKIKELTELKIFFDIHNPGNMEIECKNNYGRLSIADTINFRKALHQSLDVSLDKIGTEIFVQKTSNLKKHKEA